VVELYSLIKNLGPEELQEINRSLKEKGSENRLLGKLFSFLSSTSNNEIKDRELAQFLYGRYKPSAIPPLKSRLFRFILDTMICGKLIAREEYDNNDRKMLRVRKKMLQFRALYRKKNKPDVIVLFHLLNEIISEAKEVEQYDVLVDALFFKKTMLKVRKGFSEVRIIEKEMTKYQYAYNALLVANDHYIDLVTNQDQIKEKGKGNILQSQRKAAREIKQTLEVVKSPTILYYYHLLKLDICIKSKQLNRAYALCLAIEKLLKKHPVLHRAERMGFVFDNMCEIQVYRKNFSKAIENARQAQKFYSRSTLSFLLSRQQEFLSNFYAGNYTRAYALIEEMLLFPLLNKGEFRHDKYLFFKACTLFKLNKFTEALSICNRALKINMDKGRWDMGIRYLRLMCLIEMEDDAYNSVEALRKIISRLSRQKLISKRDQLIYRLFNEYALQAFGAGYGKKLIQTFAEIALPVNTWSFYSHEPIPIDKWLKERLKR
jgi:hypothetical protein